MKQKIVSIILLLSLSVFSSNILVFAGTKQSIQFNKYEIHLIKSLSSQNYHDKKDVTNKVSGQKDAIALGSKLFFNPLLSGDGKVSCATCHDPDKGWSNHRKITSLRPKHPAKRHVPSLWGVKYSRWLFWDGRADSLWSQALKPIEDVSEMSGNRVQIVRLIRDAPILRQQYEKVFGPMPNILLTTKLPSKARPVSSDEQHPEHKAWIKLSPPVKQAVNVFFSNIGKAIAAFEETLVSKNSRFDQFARSIDKNTGYYSNSIMSTSALNGLKTFIGKGGCTNCHFGPNFSDGEFHHSFLEPITLKHDLGRYTGIKALLKDPFNSKSVFSDADKSWNILDYVYQNAHFRGQFKTPSLRNIAQTYPYMHTGEFKDLYEVVHYYSSISKNINGNQRQELLLKSLDLSKKDINNLVEFLKTLSEVKQ
ncbi:MAG: c-type cytochrome [Proteobacteria bacterium]|nr:c-type cytochrome [Pseudomonadota bacterium]